MNDAVVQDVHYGAKFRDDSDKPKFTDDDFGELINPNIVQSPPQVTVLTNKKEKTDRLTDTTESITFPQLRLWAVMK